MKQTLSRFPSLAGLVLFGLAAIVYILAALQEGVVFSNDRQASRKMAVRLLEQAQNQSTNASFLRFEKGLRSENMLIKGFSAAENWGTWTDGAEAVLRIPLKPDIKNKPMVLQAMVDGYVRPPLLDRQVIHINANGQDIGVWEFRRRGQTLKTLPVPVSVSGGLDMLELRLRIERPTRPVDVGENLDQRQLGLAFTWLAIKSQ